MIQAQSFELEGMKPMEESELLLNCFERLVEILQFVKLRSVDQKLVLIDFVMVRLVPKMEAELFDSNQIINESSSGKLLAFDSQQVGFIFVNTYTDQDAFYYFQRTISFYLIYFVRDSLKFIIQDESINPFSKIQMLNFYCCLSFIFLYYYSYWMKYSFHLFYFTFELIFEFKTFSYM